MSRRLPAVASPISIGAVARAGFGAAFAGPRMQEQARSGITEKFGASAIIATDSGTSALVLALQLAAPRGGVVGFPGYACVDLAAAALFAGVRVRLYDLDPATLGPDLSSVERLLQRGVDVLVAAHLFGYPVDVPAMRTLAASAGVPLVEDAAQSAGGTLNGKPLGSLGDLSVLSFGRGKGLCAGGGGALLAFNDKWDDAVGRVQVSSSGRGFLGLATTAVQWGLGRPSLYAIPSMIPGLHLGEMVYHPAREPKRMSPGSSALLASALALAPGAVAIRRRHAREFDIAVSGAPRAGGTQTIPGAEPGYLRYALRDMGEGRDAAPALGIVRPYPQTLAEQPQLAPILLSGEPAIPGATELRRSLYTLPTHGFVTSSDMARITEWIRVPAHVPNAHQRARVG